MSYPGRPPMMPGLPMYAMPIGAPPPASLMPMQQVSSYFILLFMIVLVWLLIKK